MPSKDVLIVDDEPQMLIAMYETLKRDGLSIVTASSGVEAISKLKDSEYRLIITDLRMPVVTGIELLQEVKSVSPRTQVVLVTAHGSVANAVEAMKLGAFDYLLKPFSSTDLTALVRRAIRQSEGFLTVRKSHQTFPIITQDPEMLATLELAEQAAKGKSTVLIQAESGTGKELLARWIHQASPRTEGPFVAVNCAALPENLLEAELFGHEKGAFTGAMMQKAGKFEAANHGTILLDEIGEMVPLLQAKLLRVLQEQEVDRVGGTRPIPIDVRVVATTNRDLQAMVRAGSFREDLYYRLNVIPLSIPPLRNRKGDIALLAKHFCERYAPPSGRAKELAPEAIKLLCEQNWHGNARELENVIQRAMVLSTNPTVYPQDLFLPESSEPARLQSQTNSNLGQGSLPTPGTHDHEADTAIVETLDLKAGFSMSEMEKKLIHLTLAETGGNRTRAAQLLGISLRTLRNKLREYRLANAQCNSATS